MSKTHNDAVEYIYTAFITLKNGKRIYASQYGFIHLLHSIYLRCYTGKLCRSTSSFAGRKDLQRRPSRFESQRCSDSCRSRNHREGQSIYSGKLHPWYFLLSVYCFIICCTAR